MKTKMLVWSDYVVPTGFSNVMSNILRRLDRDKYSIDVLAVNYYGDPDYDHDRFPGKIYPAVTSTIRPYNDLTGRQRLIDLAREGDYDILFMLQDTFIAQDVIPILKDVREKFNKNFKMIYYFPIDSPPWMKWLKNSVCKVDVPVAYTKYGAECCESSGLLEKEMMVVPHGIDLNDFFHIEDRDNINNYRKWHFPASEGKVMLLNVNRNQPRKDIPRSLQLLHELKKTRDDICLFLHMSNKDIGGNLTPVANQLGLEENIDYFMPSDLDQKGYEVSLLNIIYNISDMLITTTLGEGWGLSLTEAMAVKLPIVAPDILPISEILGNGERGFLADSGSNASLWTIIDSDNMVLRPLVDVEDMARKIDSAIQIPAIAKHKSDQAYLWVQNLNWDTIVDKYWEEILVSD